VSFLENKMQEKDVSACSSIVHGRILRGSAHLPRDRFAPPLKIFAPPLKSHAPPLGKVSMTDQSENLTFFVCLGSTLRKKVFL
jgi:hypothetical protein